MPKQITLSESTRYLESPLGQILTTLIAHTTRILANHSKNKADTIEKKHALALTKAVHEMATALQGICLLFDQKAEPNLLGTDMMGAAWKIKNANDEFEKAMTTPEAALFEAIEKKLPAQIEQLKKKLKKDPTLKSTPFNQHLQEQVREKKELFLQAVAEIPSIHIDECFEQLIQELIPIAPQSPQKTVNATDQDNTDFEAMDEDGVKISLEQFKKKLIEETRFYRITIADPISYDLTITLFNLVNQLPKSLHELIPFFNPKAIEKDFSSFGFRALMGIFSIPPFQLKHIPSMQEVRDMSPLIDSYSYHIHLNRNSDGIFTQKIRYSVEEFYINQYESLTNYFQQITVIRPETFGQDRIVQEQTQQLDLLLRLKEAEMNILSANETLIDVPPISVDTITDDITVVQVIDGQLEQIQGRIHEKHTQKNALEARHASYQRLSVYQLAEQHQTLQKMLERMDTMQNHTEFLTGLLPESIIQLNLTPQGQSADEAGANAEPTIAKQITIKMALTQDYERQQQILENHIQYFETKKAGLNIFREEKIAVWKDNMIKKNASYADEIMDLIKTHETTFHSELQNLDQMDITDKPLPEILHIKKQILSTLISEKNKVSDLSAKIKANLRFSADMHRLDPSHHLEQAIIALYNPGNERIQQVTQDLNQQISTLQQSIHQGHKAMEIASYKAALHSSDPQKFQVLLRQNDVELQQCGEQINRLKTEILAETQQYEDIEKNIQGLIQTHGKKQIKNDKLRRNIIKEAQKLEMVASQLSSKEAKDFITGEKSTAFFQDAKKAITIKKAELTESLEKLPNKKIIYDLLKQVQERIFQEKSIIPFKALESIISKYLSTLSPPDIYTTPRNLYEVLEHFRYTRDEIERWELHRKSQIDTLGLKRKSTLPTYPADREKLLKTIQQFIDDAKSIIDQKVQYEKSIITCKENELTLISLEEQMIQNNLIVMDLSIEARIIQEQQESFALSDQRLKEKNTECHSWIEKQESLLNQHVAFKSLIDFIEKMSNFNRRIQAFNEVDQIYVNSHALNQSLINTTQSLSIEQESMRRLLTQTNSTLEKTNHPGLSEENLTSISALLQISIETLTEAIQTKKTKTHDAYETFCTDIEKQYQDIQGMENAEASMETPSIDLLHAEQLTELTRIFNKEMQLMQQMDNALSNMFPIKNPKEEKINSTQSIGIVNLAIAILSRVTNTLEQEFDVQVQLFSSQPHAENQALFDKHQTLLSRTQEQYLNPEITKKCKALVLETRPLDATRDSLEQAFSALQSAQSRLADQIKINQQHNQALAACIATRTCQINHIIAQLDEYERFRATHFAIKDYFSSTDKERRARFIEQLKNQLEEYKISGQFDARDEIILSVQAAIPRFPGQHLQGILYQLLDTLYNFEPNASSIRLQPHHDAHEEALRLLDQKPHKASMLALYTEIEKIKRYGHTLSRDEASRIQGTQLTNLADELETSVNQFIIEHAGHIPQQDKFLAFKNKLIAHIHHHDSEMKIHRHAWKPLLANITIGVSTLGIALGFQLLQSKLSQGHASLFFAKTNRQLKIEALSEFVQHLH